MKELGKMNGININTKGMILLKQLTNEQLGEVMRQKFNEIEFYNEFGFDGEIISEHFPIPCFSTGGAGRVFNQVRDVDGFDWMYEYNGGKYGNEPNSQARLNSVLDAAKARQKALEEKQMEEKKQKEWYKQKELEALIFLWNDNAIDEMEFRAGFKEITGNEYNNKLTN